MKKIFKALTVLLLAAVAACACALCITACGGESKSDYNFTIVYENGTPVNGQTDGEYGKVSLQICSAVTSACYPFTILEEPIYADANGKVSLSQKQVNEIMGSDEDVDHFKFGVMDVKNYSNGSDGILIVVDGKGDYTVVIK